MRTLLLTLLLWPGTVLVALETPLILQTLGDQSDNVVVVNPGLGTMQLYRSNIRTLEQLDSGNFLAHLDYLSKFPLPSKPEWTLLRTGSQTAVPTYADMLDTVLASAARERRDDDAQLPLHERASNSEEIFWSGQPQFDGTVYGAALNDTFVLVIPSLYTLLFYSTNNDEIELAGWRNYRTDLYIPQVYQSEPLPQEILQQLPEDVRAERRAAIEQRMQQLGEAAGQMIQLAPSDPWIGSTAAGGNLFVLVDQANRRALIYQARRRGRQDQLHLLAARNLEIDLMIPTTFRSTPDVAGLIQRYNQHLSREDLPEVLREEIEALVSDARVESEKNSTFHAAIDAQGVLQLDFHEERQLLTYRMSTQGLDLIAARDYTLEAGIGIHRRMLILRERAKGLIGHIENSARAKDWDALLRYAEIALSWNPWLHEELGSNRRISRIERSDRFQDWVALIDAAAAEAERREREAAERRERALQIRKIREERREER